MDRAALDVALDVGLSVGGWCPKGRLSEDGPIPGRYPLAETKTAAYDERTELNVRDSDATLVITRGTPTGGTAYTITMADKWNRPCRVVDLDEPLDKVEVVRWLSQYGSGVLNVAGPRESTVPGIYAEASAALVALLEEVGSTSDADLA